MKPIQRYLLWCLLSWSTSISLAQEIPGFECGFDTWRATSKMPGIHSFDNQLRQHLSKKGQRGMAESSLSGLPYIVPVVVHIIHNGGPENISDARVLAAIDHLNAGFAAQGYFAQKGATVNSQIQFCLAKRDPNGNNTTGITRNQSPLTNMVMETEDIITKDINRWNPTQYVNIWVVNEITSQSQGPGVAGYAFFPGAHGLPEDGMICEARFFGTSPSEDAILIHEMGHYFGLYHTFEGGCANNDCTMDGDKVCDTPPDNATHTACPFNSCSTDVAPGSPFATDVDDFTEDFMDYSPFACYYAFTAEQALRMQGSVETARASLLQSKGCLEPCTQPIVAAFTAAPNPVLLGQTVVFTNNSSNGSTYSWSENGMEFAQSPNTSLTFNTVGTHNVVLTVSNSDPNCTETISVPVQVQCNILTSFTPSQLIAIEGSTLVFTNTTTGGVVQDYEWSVNGQVVSNATDLTFTFQTYGVYTVMLTASGPLCNQTATVQITITNPCGLTPEPAQRTYTAAQKLFQPRGLVALQDGSIIQCGEHFQRLMVTRWDANGNLLWNREAPDDGTITQVEASPDNHLLMTGEIGGNIFIVKIDLNGNLIWSKTLQGTLDSGYVSQKQFTTLAINPDGTFGLLYHDNFQNGAILSKFDAGGSILWTRKFFNGGSEGILRIAKNGSGDFVLATYDPLVPSGGGFYIVMVGQDGSLKGSRKHINPASPLLWVNNLDLSLHDDGGYSIFYVEKNAPNSFTGRKFMARYAADGTLKWSRRYVLGNGDLYRGSYIRQLPAEKGWVVIDSRTNPTSGALGDYLERLDTNGQIMWARHLGDTPANDFWVMPPVYQSGLLRSVHCDFFNFDLHVLDIHDSAKPMSCAPVVAGNEQNQPLQNSKLATNIVSGTKDVPVVDLPLVLSDAPLTLRETCSAPPSCPETCDNELDDDDDGLVDCFDSDCPCFDTDTTCLVDPPVNNFAAQLSWETPTDQICMAGVPIIANLNPQQDSIPEIIVLEGLPDAVATITAFNFLIYKSDGSNASAPNQLNVPQGVISNLPVHPTVADLDRNGVPELVVVSQDANIRVYTGFDPNATPCMSLWTVSDLPSGSGDSRVYTADFDGDGIGELFCGNEVFKLDLTNPAAPGLVKVLNGVGASGSFAGLPFEIAQSSTAADLLSIGDCNGDPDCAGLEIAAGYHIYSVDLDPNDGDGYQIKIQRDLTQLDPSSTYKDGYTSIADLNLDGIPEVIVSGASGGIYAWNKNGPLHVFNAPSIGALNGMVCIADVYDDKKAGFSQNFPELIVCQALGLLCFNLQKAQATPGQPFWWQLTTTDPSGATGVSVFDFNGDGLSEIVYRDQDDLRILYGGPAPFPPGVDTERNWFKTATGSLTLDEYPVVADLNNDKEAEIVVAGYSWSVLNNTSIIDTRAKLRVFKSASQPWQPARPIWNQYNYFGVNINDDLSVPKNQQKHWLEMGGIGSGNRPFNQHLAQVSSLNPYVTNKVKAPDASLGIDSAFCHTDSFTVYLSVCNQGAITLPVSTPISFYNGDPTTSSAAMLFPAVLLSEAIPAGQCKTIHLSLPAIYNTSIFAVVNDDGSLPRPFNLATDFPATSQEECHYENNITSFSIQNQPPVLDLGPDVMMCKSSVTSLSASPGFQKYRWQDGSTAQHFTAYTPGKYWVNVVDACGFIQSDTINILLNTLDTLDLPETLAVCAGMPAQLVASGFAKYSWAPSNVVNCADCASVGILSAQPVTIYLTATQGDCFVTDSVRVNVNAAPILTLLPQDGECNTPANITAVVQGNGPFDFLWTDSSTDSVLTTLLPGNYTVEITDQNGCTVSDSAAVSILNSMQLSSSFIEPDCANASTGSVNLTINGGTLPFQFLWSNNATTEDLTNVQAGIYTVLTTDGNGCSSTVSVTLNAPTDIVLALQTTDPRCAGEASGAIDLTATGGTGNLGFAWSNSANLEDLSGLLEGAYTVVVSDANGCTRSLSSILNDPPAITLSLQSSNPNCAGEPSGAIDLTATGGTGNLSFAWSNSTNLEDLNGLQAGAYTVVVTDANGCIGALSDTLVAPPAIVLGMQSIDPKCAGEASGSIDLNASGGTGNLGFAWSNGANVEDLNGLQAGIYSVIVMDANGCTRSLADTLNAPPTLLLSLQKTDPKCADEASGAIDLTASGGTGNLGFAWSNNANLEDLSGLLAGTYTVVVTDANGCTSSLSGALLAPPAIALGLQSTNPKCAGETSGVIDLTASGGTGNLSFAWSNSSNLEDQAGLQTGAYTVIVTDTNGCTRSISDTLLAPPAIVLDLQKTDLDCSGGTGSIAVTVGNGVSPFSFLWSNGATTQDIIITQAGTFLLTVTDANDCTASTGEAVVQLEAPTGVVLADSVRCFGETNGAIRVVSANGGTPPLSYSIDNQTFASTPDFENLAAGIYQLVIRDVNGCTFTQTVPVYQPAPISVALTGDTLVFAGEWANLQATLVPNDFAAQIQWFANGVEFAQHQLLESIQIFESTLFQIRTEDVNGCEAEDSWFVMVDQGHQIFTPTALFPDSDDGHNRVFTIYADQSIQEIESLEIFDRWGNLLYSRRHLQPNDESQGWDGSFRGKLLAPAVFVWSAKIAFKDGSTTQKKGELTLIR